MFTRPAPACLTCLPVLPTSRRRLNFLRYVSTMIMTNVISSLTSPMLCNVGLVSTVISPPIVLDAEKKLLMKNSSAVMMNEVRHPV